MSINEIAAQAGFKYRLQILTANMQCCEPEFLQTKTAALRRRSDLRGQGYVIAVFAITAAGGLDRVA